MKIELYESDLNETGKLSLRNGDKIHPGCFRVSIKIFEQADLVTFFDGSRHVFLKNRNERTS